MKRLHFHIPSPKFLWSVHRRFPGIDEWNRYFWTSPLGNNRSVFPVVLAMAVYNPASKCSSGYASPESPGCSSLLLPLMKFALGGCSFLRLSSEPPSPCNESRYPWGSFLAEAHLFFCCVTIGFGNTSLKTVTAWKLYQVQQFVFLTLRNTQKLLKLLRRSENSHTLPKTDSSSPSAGLWAVQGCVPILPACVSGVKTGRHCNCGHAKSSV